MSYPKKLEISENPMCTKHFPIVEGGRPWVGTRKV